MTEELAKKSSVSDSAETLDKFSLSLNLAASDSAKPVEADD